MKAELIIIGDELLIGQIVDTNSSWMSFHLNEIGIQVKRISTIPDCEEDIINALALATAHEIDVVLITGGLGPTKDDVTKQALSKYFNSELVFDKEVLKHVLQIFEKYNKPMPTDNIKQAEVLKVAEVMFNNAGTAPGMWIKDKHRVVAVMPGVPSEMKYLMENEVLPRLRAMPDRKAFVHVNILTAGLGESFLAEKIAFVENCLPPNIHLAYLPSYAQVRLRLSAEGTDKTYLTNQINQYAKEIKSSLIDYYVNDNEQSLEETLLFEMSKKNLTLSIAESCTGGLISHLITQVPGSSQVFLGSVVSYSNAVKINSLEIKREIIDKYGAVSEQTAHAMAIGVKEKINSNYSIAITGIAGPEGGTLEKPVGTVWIAISGRSKTIQHHFLFGKRREDNIMRASKNALHLLLRLVREEN